MRKIILAKRAGFCFGVKRAVEMAEKALFSPGFEKSDKEIMKKLIEYSV